VREGRESAAPPTVTFVSTPIRTISHDGGIGSDASSSNHPPEYLVRNQTRDPPLEHTERAHVAPPLKKYGTDYAIAALYPKQRT
jgi:hypothetical protein